MQVTTMTDQLVTIIFHIFMVTILGNLSLWTSAKFPSLFYIFCLELTLPTLSFKNENIDTPTSVMLIYSSLQFKRQILALHMSATFWNKLQVCGYTHQGKSPVHFSFLQNILQDIKGLCLESNYHLQSGNVRLSPIRL